MSTLFETRFSASGVVFDLDGVLVDSVAVANRAWTAWAKVRGLSVETVLGLTRGGRPVDSIRFLLPDSDPEAEADWLVGYELSLLNFCTPMPGAIALARSLPSDRWAVATSSSRELAVARLKYVGLELPSVLVASEDVERGKPEPDPYLHAAQALGLDARLDWIGIDDSNAGLQSVRSAGGVPCGVSGSAGPAKLEAAQFVIESLESVQVYSIKEGCIEFHLRTLSADNSDELR